jgi:large subunit ribosomal protein L15
MFNDGDIVSSKELISKGVIKKVGDGIKILAKGSLTKKLTIKANKFSQKAVREIESAGGKIEVV